MSNGGGVFLAGGSLSNYSLAGCTVAENVTVDFGAGIGTKEYANVRMVNCLIDGNTSSFQGGGVYLYGANTRIHNTAVVNNTSGQGGGIYNEFWAGTQVLELINCTVAGNAGSSWLGDPGGSGLHIANGDGDVSITNSILWGNTSTGGGNQIRSVDALITARYSNIQRTALDQSDVRLVGGSIDADSTVIGTIQDEHNPRFLSPPTTYTLVNGPNRNFCIDSGDNLAVPVDVLDVDADMDFEEKLPLDLANVGRIKDDLMTPKGNSPRGTGNPLGACEYVDMGAFEYGTGSSTMTDCNDNGRADMCDLFDQTSTDCNENLVPDECEGVSSTPELILAGDCAPN